MWNKLKKRYGVALYMAIYTMLFMLIKGIWDAFVEDMNIAEAWEYIIAMLAFGIFLILMAYAFVMILTNFLADSDENNDPPTSYT